MTKKEMFAEIINVATVADRQDIVDFAQKEIELLNKRNSKESKAAKAKAEERANLAEAIMEVLEGAEEPMRTMEIASAVGISPQKASPILKVMLAEGRINIVNGKRVSLYMVAET